MYSSVHFKSCVICIMSMNVLSSMFCTENYVMDPLGILHFFLNVMHFVFPFMVSVVFCFTSSFGFLGSQMSSC